MSSILVVLLAACQGPADLRSSPGSTPAQGPVPQSPAPTAAPPTPATALSQDYLRQVRDDGATSIWPLGDRAAARAGDRVGDAGPSRRHAQIAGSLLVGGPGPRLRGRATTAARLDGRTRAVAPAVMEISDTRAFSIDLWFLGGTCPRTWYTLAGTSRRTTTGRTGFDLIYYPLPLTTACRLGAEFWQDGRGRGGCDTTRPVVKGRWTHFAVTYDRQVLTCFVDGTIASRVRILEGRALPLLPFGLGGTGSGFGRNLAGSLAYVAVYPRALSPQRIAAHAAAGA